MERTPSSPRLGYQPSLDGMRAVAVTAVVVYHASPSLLPGGYIGVDLFFVLSGFLITRLLVEEYEAWGRVSLLRFWARRALRLLPALAVLIVAVMAYVTLAHSPQASATRSGLLPTVLYANNWVTAFSGRSLGFFDHLWSLSVEEQFYLVWPLILIALLRHLRKSQIAGLCVAAWLTVVVGCAIASRNQPGLYRLYYGTDARSGALWLGCALGLGWAPMARMAAETRRRLAAGAALVLLAVAVVAEQGNAAMFGSGGFGLVGLGGVTVIAYLVAEPASAAARALGARGAVLVGQRSYGMYLWHYPVMIVLATLVPGGAVLVVAVWAASLGMASLSWTMVETPLRRRYAPRLATSPSAKLPVDSLDTGL